ncbi:MAG: hypothetical protein V5B44_19540 [Candidatus Accumulibacter necessarius]|jgi:ribosome-associated toxin RatA of RatAB toxin-antitoxin module
MKITLVDGPFRRLDGLWRFKPLSRRRLQDRVPALLRVLQQDVRKGHRPVFSQIANTFVDAFVKRANEVHGVPNA